MKFERNRGERRDFIQKDVARFARDSGRAKILQRFERSVRELDAELIRAENEEETRWQDFRVVTLDGIEIVPLTAEIFDETIAVQIGGEIDRFPDATIFASVTRYLEGIRAAGLDQPAYFLSRDKKDFAKPVVINKLRRLNCDYIGSFEHGLARIRENLP